MKRVVIILVALVALASGAAYFVIGGGDKEEDAEVAAIDTSRHTYINLPAISVTLFRNNRPAGRMIAVLVLDVAGISGEARVRAQMDLLHDAYFRTLHDIGEQLPPDAVNVDIDTVKNRILGATLQHVEAGAVRDVLVQNIIIQRR